MSGQYRAVVIGIGNEFRRDDGAGPAVVDRLRGEAPAGVRLVVSDGEPAGLLEAWTDADLAVVVDAVSGGSAPPGQLYRVTVHGGDGRELDDLSDGASTHNLGLGTAIGLSRALARMPGALIVHAVEGADFGYGQGLSAAVDRVLAELVTAVLADLRLPPPPGTRARRR